MSRKLTFTIIVGTVFYHGKCLGMQLRELILMNTMGSAWGIDTVREGSYKVVRPVTAV